jgi:hypothetical protein
MSQNGYLVSTTLRGEVVHVSPIKMGTDACLKLIQAFMNDHPEPGTSPIVDVYDIEGFWSYQICFPEVFTHRKEGFESWCKRGGDPCPFTPDQMARIKRHPHYIWTIMIED